MTLNRSRTMSGLLVSLLVVVGMTTWQPADVVAQQPQWGSVRGRFVYRGTPPAPRFIEPVGENTAFLRSMPQILDESLIVDSQTHGVKNIVVYAKRVSRVHPKYEWDGHGPLKVDIQGCQFRPHVTAMRVDRPLAITNLDPIAHTASIQPPLEMGLNALLAPGEQLRYSFPRQEGSPVAVFCRLYPWTAAYVLPRDNPYFAVSDAEGNFEIAHLPANEEIEWIVWHERVFQPNWCHNLLPVTLFGNAMNDVGEIEICASAFAVDHDDRR